MKVTDDQLHALDACSPKPVDLSIRNHGMVMDYSKVDESFEAIDGLNVKVIIGTAPEWAYQMVDVVPAIKPNLCDLREVFMSQLDITKKLIHLWNRLSVV